jgi:hypothetical protein
VLLRPDYRLSRPHARLAALCAVAASVAGIFLPVALYLIPYLLAFVGVAWTAAYLCLRGQPDWGRDAAAGAFIVHVVASLGSAGGFTSTTQALIAVATPLVLLVVAMFEADRAARLRRRAWRDTWQMKRAIDQARSVRAAGGLSPGAVADSRLLVAAGHLEATYGQRVSS